MKTLPLALVLALSGFGQASADELNLYCVELRPRPCEINALTTNQLYNWYGPLHVGDIVFVEFWNHTNQGATCEPGGQQYQHRTVLLSSCGGPGVSNEGWMFFYSNHHGEEFEVVSVNPY